MTCIPVGHELDEQWAFLDCILLCKFHGLSHREHIVSIGSDSRDLVTSGVEVRIHR